MRLFIKGDDVLGTLPGHNDDAVIGIDPLHPHQVVGESRETGDVVARLIANEIDPTVLGGNRRRRLRQLEIYRAVIIGADHPAVCPVIELILHADPARFSNGWRGSGVGGVDQPDLCGFLIAHMDDDMAVIAGGADAQEHALVGFFIDQHVLAASRGAAKHFRGASILVAPDPEQPGAVGRKCEVAIGAVDLEGQSLVGGQVLDPDRVVF